MRPRDRLWGSRESEEQELFYLLCWPTHFPGMLGWWVSRDCCWSWELRKQDEWGRTLEEKICKIHCRWVQMEEGEAKASGLLQSWG